MMTQTEIREILIKIREKIISIEEGVNLLYSAFEDAHAEGYAASNEIHSNLLTRL